MRLGQLPHNPRWALNLFACVAILGAANAAGVHYLQLDRSTTARYVSKRLRAFRAAAAFWIFFVALTKLFVKGFWPLTKYTDQTYLLLGVDHSQSTHTSIPLRPNVPHKRYESADLGIWHVTARQ